MTYADYLKFFFALVFVLSLMGGLAFVMKRLGLGQFGVSRVSAKQKKRLQIIEILPLDAKRKAMIIQRDNTQHLILLSATGETVIETNIKPPKDQEAKDKKAMDQKND